MPGDNVNDEMRNLLPTFIGIGAPKTATTFLDQCLKAHPEIYIPLSKEPHYFSGNYFRGLEEYLGFFRGAGSYECRGEISTSYFHHPDAPERVHDLIPDAKIVLSVRNPAEQVYSFYWQLKRHNFYQTRDNDVNVSFREALDKYPDRLLEPAKYRTHLARWRQLFDDSRIHVVFYDDIRADVDGALAALFEFLGVSAELGLKSVRSSGKTVLGGVTPRSELVGKLYGHVYVGLSKRVFMPMKRKLGYRSALWLKDKLKIRELLGKLFFKPGYPPLSAADREWILERFEQEIRGLESFTGRDLSSWRSANES